MAPTTSTADLRVGRELFDVPAEVAYFNTANLAPQLHAVRAAGERALAQRAQPWKITPEDWFSDVERLRAAFARIIGADPDGVALVPAASYGFAVAAQNLGLAEGDRVLVLAEEYPSGIYTWRAATAKSGAEILTVTRERGQTWTDAILAGLDERVRIVSVPHVHWTDGALVDLAQVARRVRKLNAKLVIDGSQSIGAMPFDVGELLPDFVVSVGYKWLLGPFGVGYLYVADSLRGGEPLEQNWILRIDAEDFARLVDYRDEYQPGARRFDVGERTNFELTPMAVAALEQILDWTVDGIATSLHRQTNQIACDASELGLNPMPEDERGPHMLGVQLPDELRQPVLRALEDANVHAAIRGGALRIAPHLHIDDHDLARLRASLTEALESNEGAAPA